MASAALSHAQKAEAHIAHIFDYEDSQERDSKLLWVLGVGFEAVVEALLAVAESVKS